MRLFHGTRFFFKLTFICVLFILLTLFPGSFTIEWLGWRTKLPIPIIYLLAGNFLLISIVILIYQIYRWCVNLPNRTKSFIQQRRIKKFEDVFIEGLTAIAAQQPEEAQNYADLAQSLSPNHPLALFLTGQTSYLNQDYALAQNTFSLMLNQPSLKFLGLRGLVLLAVERSDWVSTQTYLEQLFDIYPDSPWVLKQLEINSLRLALTDKTNKSTDMLAFYRQIQKEEAYNHQGLISWIKLNHNKNIHLNQSEQFELLKNTYDLMPWNPIVASHYALELQIRDHKPKALRILQRSYKLNPHRHLAETWLALINVKKELDVYKKIEKLTTQNPSHEESYWILTKKALEADLWGQARHHIQPLLYNTPTKSIYQLMIDIEEKENPDQPSKTEFWKNKLEETQLEWEWSCKSCGNMAPTWDAFCSACGNFGAIEWGKISYHSQAPLKNKLILSQPRII